MQFKEIIRTCSYNNTNKYTPWKKIAELINIKYVVYTKINEL
jgi:hypothetical protein